MAIATKDAFRVVDQFEEALAEFTGAPYAATTDSCTNAIRLCLELKRERHRSGDGGWPNAGFIPAHTYVGVAQAIRSVGLPLEFREEKWVGEYEIKYIGGLWDSAKWFRRGMYRSGTKMCVSFHIQKQLPIGRGGAILCDKREDYEWFRRSRLDGREPGTAIADQARFERGHHCYMTPPDAARGLWLLSWMNGDSEPIGSWEGYPDLRTKEFA